MIYKDVYKCDENKILQENISLQKEQEEQYTCKFDEYQEQISILRMIRSIKEIHHKDDMKNNKEKLLRLYTEVWISKEQLQNQQWSIEISFGDEDSTKYYFTQGKILLKWIQLIFDAKIHGNYDLIQITFQVKNIRELQLKQQNSTNIFQFKIDKLDSFFFEGNNLIVGQICTDVSSFGCTQQNIQDLLLIQLKSEQSQQICQNGYEFSNKMNSCIRKQSNQCSKGMKEILHTKECVRLCPPDQIEFNLHGKDQKSLYCSKQNSNCKEGCKMCDLSKQICFLCKEGYTHYLNECLPKQISSSLRILQTNDRCKVYINQGTKCITCYYPFVNNKGSCYWCSRGTYPGSDGHSEFCGLIPIDGCGDVDSSHLTCTSCFLGYHLSSGTCIRTTTCSSTQYLGIDNICHSCSEIYGCLECYSNLACKTCQTDYVLKVEDGSTDNPYLGCIHYQCTSGYFLNSLTNYCQSCGYQCGTCTSETGLVCSQCFHSGYILNSSYNTNYPSRKEICQLDPGDCDTQCSDCNGTANICDSSHCISGSFYDGNGKCIKCSDYCQTCSSTTICSQCNGDAVLSSGQCTLICSGGTYIDAYYAQCFQCISNCASCSNYLTCDICSPGFVSLGGNCSSCPLNCQTCSNEVTCTTCMTGYTVSANSCLPCLSHCSTCSSPTVCIMCNTNYTLVSSSQCSIASLCGDGQMLIPMAVSGILKIKECDDLNAISGDGCSSGCLIESQYSCQHNGVKSICSKKNNFQLVPQLKSKNEGPMIDIIFDYSLINNQETLLSLSESNISTTIASLEFSKYSCQFQLNDDLTQITLTFTLSQSVKNTQITVLFNNPFFIQSNKLSTNTKTCQFPDFYFISEEQKSISESVATSGQAVSSSVLASIIPVILFANFSLLFQAVDLFQMIFYLKYVNIRLPQNIIAFINKIQSFNLPFSIGFIENLKKEYPLQESIVPQSFADGKLGGTFLANAGEGLFQIFLLGGIHFVLILISKLLKKVKQPKYAKIGSIISKKLVETWEFGFYLDVYWEIYLVLVISGTLQLYQIKVSSFFLGVNIICSFVIFLATIISPFYFIYIIRSKKHQLEEDHVKFKWGMLYESLVVSHEPHHKNQVIPIEGTSQNKPSLDLEILEQNTNKNEFAQNELIASKKQENSIEKEKHSEDKFDLKEKQQIHKNIQKENLGSFSFSHSMNASPLKQRITKKLIFGIMIVTFYNYPYPQLILNNIMSFILIFLIIFTKPFNSKFENIKSFICEILMIITQISLELLINDPNDQTEDNRLNIGWIFILCCLLIMLIQLFFILHFFLPKMFIELKKICKKKKLHKKSQNKQRDNSQDLTIQIPKIEPPLKLNQNENDSGSGSVKVIDGNICLLKKKKVKRKKKNSQMNKEGAEMKSNFQLIQKIENENQVEDQKQQISQISFTQNAKRFLLCNINGDITDTHNKQSYIQEKQDFNILKQDFTQVSSLILNKEDDCNIQKIELKEEDQIIDSEQKQIDRRRKYSMFSSSNIMISQNSSQIVESQFILNKFNK